MGCRQPSGSHQAVVIIATISMGVTVQEESVLKKERKEVKDDTLGLRLFKGKGKKKQKTLSL